MVSLIILLQDLPKTANTLQELNNNHIYLQDNQEKPANPGKMLILKNLARFSRSCIMVVMDNNLLLSLLQNKLAETEQEASRLREVAAKAQIEASIMEALAQKIQSTIDSLIATHGKEMSHQDYQETIQGLSGTESSLGDTYSNQEQTIKNFRLPKDMKRIQYKRTKGYVKITTQILSNYPGGLHIDQLTDMIFETSSPDELARARNSLLAELNRGVKEGRLTKMGDSDYFLLPPQFSETNNTELSQKSIDILNHSKFQFNGTNSLVNS